MATVTRSIQAEKSGVAQEPPTPCPHCGGDGTIPSIEWAAFWALWYAAYVQAWNAGVLSPTAEADETAGEPPDCEEDIPCPRCGEPRGGAAGAVARAIRSDAELVSPHCPTTRGELRAAIDRWRDTAEEPAN